jgi:hypothetical protein
MLQQLVQGSCQSRPLAVVLCKLKKIHRKTRLAQRALLGTNVPRIGRMITTLVIKEPYQTPQEDCQRVPQPGLRRRVQSAWG